MSAFRLLKLELAKLVGKKGLFILLGAVLLVPIVYSAIMLSPKWGPYDNLDHLPVAVVNQDEGATSGDTPVNVGKDLVSDLKSSKDLGWDFVSKEQAQKGLDNQKYYMVIEIPNDFSKKVTTVLDSDPQVPKLHYIQNEGLNFLAAQVTKTATEQIREKLGDKITETYTKSLFTKLGEISSGFQAGADGSDKIYNGSADLQAGTGQLLQSLREKSGDINKLASGSKDLQNGSQQLLNSLTSKQGDIAKLAEGSQQLKDGTGVLLTSLQQGAGKVNQLAVGSRKVSDGAIALQAGTSKILDGLKKSEAGSNQLSGALAQLSPGSAQVAGGVDAVSKGADQLAGGSQSLAAGMGAFLAKHPELQSDKEFLTLVGTSKAVSAGMTDLATKTKPLVAGANQVAGGLAQTVPGASALSSGMSQLVEGQTAVNEGLNTLSGGAKQVADGNKVVNSGWNDLTSGVSTLYSGTDKVSSGNNEVNNGWKSLSAGAGQLNDGMVQVSNGNETVKDGWGTLTDGVTKIDAGVGQLKDGSQELTAGLGSGAEETGKISLSDKNVAMFSAPVKLSGEKMNGFEFYRDSTAPYLMALALFVGILVLSFMVDFRKPVEIAVSAFSWYASKLMQLSIFAIAQALLLSLFTLFIIGLNVENAFSFILFSVFVSLSFLMIIFFLVSLGGNIGRFVAFALLVLQLSITGANLPIDMLPSNLQNLSAFLPMTYAIAGFKSIISLGDSSYLWDNVGVLFIYLAVFAVLSLPVFFIKYRNRTEAKHLAA